jgi:hypothetical protein
MLAGLRFADPQLRALAATPRDHQDHFTCRLIDVRDDGRDEGPQQPLTGAHGRAWRVPGSHQIVGQPGKVGGGAVAESGVRTASPPRLARLDRRSAASQLFSSCAAIRRLSGSQAAYRRSASEAS